MVTKERVTSNPEETISQGLIIAATIVNRVHNVIAEESPLLAKKANLLKPNKLFPASLDELVALEDLITPISAMGFYRSLLASGVSKDVVDLHRKDSIDAYYSDPTDQDSLLIHDDILKMLSQDKHKKTIASAMALNMLHQTIYLQPELRVLDQTPIWREIMRRSINSDSFSAKARKVSLTIKSAQIDQTRRILEQSLDAPEARFAARGASVFLFLPHQEFPVYEHSMGQVFEEGIVIRAADSLHEKVLDSLREDNLIDQRTSQSYLSQLQQDSGIILAREISEMIGLSQEELLEAYLNSDIPRYYIGTDVNMANKKLNYLVYPE